MIVHYDCRHFLGHKPCMFRRECEGCPHYALFGERILILKLGAMGDVLRTTSLLHGLRRAYPNRHVTWLTESNVVPMLRGISEIDRLMPYSWESAMQLRHETFDRLYCFDKEPKAIALTMEIQAKDRSGFGMSQYGNVRPLGPNSEYMFELGINDNLKFRQNGMTYPELIYECAGLPYLEPQEYILPDLSEEIAAGKEHLRSLGIPTGMKKVGFNTGAGDIFATKKWTEEGYAGLADLVAGELGAAALLLGGPAETERNARIATAASRKPFNTGTDHEIRSFAGIVGNLDLMVTGDTLAMHIAIGLKVPVVVLFGATCHQEIELYGRGEKIVSDFPCSPCYQSRCPQEVNCMEAIPPRRVMDAIARVLRSSETNRR